MTINMSNPSQEALVSFKAPNEDLKDMDFLCTFKIKIERQNLIPNPSQEPPASSKAQNEDLKDMNSFCSFQIKIESQN